MRHITVNFEAVQAADLRFLLNIPARDARDYLVVTGLNLHDPMHVARAGSATALTIPLTLSLTADSTLGHIAAWMNDHNALDQSAFYGADINSYNIGFYRLDSGGMNAPSLREDFYLYEYNLPCRSGAPASFADVMWTLDRDKMAMAMRKSLTDDFEMSPAPYITSLWQGNMRACCHPDKAFQRNAMGSNKLPSPALSP